MSEQTYQNLADGLAMPGHRLFSCSQLPVGSSCQARSARRVKSVRSESMRTFHNKEDSWETLTGRAPLQHPIIHVLSVVFLFISSVLNPIRSLVSGRAVAIVGYSGLRVVGVAVHRRGAWRVRPYWTRTVKRAKSIKSVREWFQDLGATSISVEYSDEPRQYRALVRQWIGDVAAVECRTLQSRTGGVWWLS